MSAQYHLLLVKLHPILSNAWDDDVFQLSFVYLAVPIWIIYLVESGQCYAVYEVDEILELKMVKMVMIGWWYRREQYDVSRINMLGRCTSWGGFVGAKVIGSTWLSTQNQSEQISPQEFGPKNGAKNISPICMSHTVPTRHTWLHESVLEKLL